MGRDRDPDRLVAVGYEVEEDVATLLRQGEDAVDQAHRARGRAGAAGRHEPDGRGHPVAGSGQDRLGARGDVEVEHTVVGRRIDDRRKGSARRRHGDVGLGVLGAAELEEDRAAGQLDVADREPVRDGWTTGRARRGRRCRGRRAWAARRGDPRAGVGHDRIADCERRQDPRAAGSARPGGCRGRGGGCRGRCGRCAGRCGGRHTGSCGQPGEDLRVEEGQSWGEHGGRRERGGRHPALGGRPCGEGCGVGGRLGPGVGQWRVPHWRNGFSWVDLRSGLHWVAGQWSGRRRRRRQGGGRPSGIGDEDVSPLEPGQQAARGLARADRHRGRGRDGGVRLLDDERMGLSLAGVAVGAAHECDQAVRAGSQRHPGQRRTLATWLHRRLVDEVGSVIEVNLTQRCRTGRVDGDEHCLPGTHAQRGADRQGRGHRIAQDGSGRRLCLWLGKPSPYADPQRPRAQQTECRDGGHLASHGME